MPKYNQKQMFIIIKVLHEMIEQNAIATSSGSRCHDVTFDFTNFLVDQGRFFEEIAFTN